MPTWMFVLYLSRTQTADALMDDAQEWWKNSLSGLSEAYPARHSGYWPDKRLTVQA